MNASAKDDKTKICNKSQKEVVVTFVGDNDVRLIKEKSDVQKPTENVSRSRSGNTSEKSKVRKKASDSSNTSSNVVDDDGDGTPFDKPLALFQDGDIPGKAVFGFLTPKRKNAMAEKATLSADKCPKSCQSPSTPTMSKNSKKFGFSPRVRRSINLNSQPMENQSPVGDKHQKFNDPILSSSDRKLTSNQTEKKNTPVTEKKYISSTSSKTPYSLRARLKTKIAAQVIRDNNDVNSDEDDETEDEFIPSDNSDVPEDVSDSDSESDSDRPLQSWILNSKPFSSKREPLRPVASNTAHSSRAVTRKDVIYAIAADDYFNSNNGKKNKTSNHTLSKLKNPKMHQQQLDTLLRGLDQRSTHANALQTLRNDICVDGLFNKWCFSLEQGYSMLVYGLGSKRWILNRFQQTALHDCHVLVINGFFPGLSIKEIVDSLAGELLDTKEIPSQTHEVIEMVESKLKSRGAPRIFIIVHNLDGVMLRCDKAQALLARLASIPKCCLLASIDHINASLLWDDKKLSEYNFIWEDVTGYVMYTEETSFENSLLVQRSGTLALASLKNVFQSLTNNGKDIFKILVEDRLANAKDNKYMGIGFSDLYWRCRDNFLVSTDLALRSQLTEFIDHQLVKWRKDSDHLFIPVDVTVLEQFQNILQDVN